MTKTFKFLFLGRVLSSLGDSLIPAALALAVLRATGSASALALVLACATIPKLILLPFGGVAADRYSARRMALAADIARTGTQLFVGFELLSGHPTLSHIAIAAVLGGIASGFAVPTDTALIAATVDSAHRMKANSLIGVVGSITRIAGPGLAGALIWLAGPGWAFILDAGTFAISALILVLVRVPHTPIAVQSMWADLAEGWTEVKTRDWYWSSLIAHAAWNGVAAVLLTLGPAIAVKSLGGENVWIAILQAGAIGLLLGSLLARWARPKRPVLAANLGLATYALPLVCLGLTAPAPLVIAAYGVAMAALGFLNPVWTTVVQKEIPPHALSRVNSYDWLFSLAAVPLGYAVAPLASSPEAPLLIAAAIVAIACLGTAAARGVREVGLDRGIADRAIARPALPQS